MALFAELVNRDHRSRRRRLYGSELTMTGNSFTFIALWRRTCHATLRLRAAASKQPRDRHHDLTNQKHTLFIYLISQVIYIDWVLTLSKLKLGFIEFKK